jgi:hypothetical protein
MSSSGLQRADDDDDYAFKGYKRKFHHVRVGVAEERARWQTDREAYVQLWTVVG